MTSLGTEMIADSPENQIKDSITPTVEISGSTPMDIQKNEVLKEIKNLKKDNEGVSAVGNISNDSPGLEESLQFSLVKSESVKQLSEQYAKRKGKWPHIFNKEKSLNWPDLTRDHNSIRLDVETSGNLLIRTVTWNQQAQAHPHSEELREKLLTEDRYHLYVIGTQECEHSIAHSLVNQSKLQWEKLLRETLGNNYDMIQSHTLQASHLIMFMHKALTPLITEISSFSVPCGIGNQLGNKGGIAISISLSSTSFLFVNSHLTSGQGAYQLRNLNYHRIQTELIRLIEQDKIAKRRDSKEGKNLEKKLPSNDKKRVYPMDSNDSMENSESEEANDNLNMPEGAPQLQNEKTNSTEESYSGSYLESILKMAPKDYDYHNPQRKLVDLFDHVFWFGDFNYRINGSINTISSLLDKDYHEVLLNNDQLKIAMRKNEAFHGFIEGPLNFRPTYKLKKGTDEYDLEKKRIPSWTDRILYTSNDNELLLYAAVRELKCSDHRPVMASFRTKVKIDIVPSTLTTVGNHKSEVCTIS